MVMQLIEEISAQHGLVGRLHVFGGAALTNALRRCLLDGSVIIAALKAITVRFWNGDLLAIFDLVASGIVEELDFRNEARNAKAFKASLSFLGYVDVPRTLPELTTRRAMAMEWVHGRHLSDLAPEEAMRMTFMSCEAVTAGLVLTGLVHADPHEGNIMLADDGRLVFLDFGLMSRVDGYVCEAFASGIQCVLSKDYDGLVRAFIDTGFVGDPLEWRAADGDAWQSTHPSGRPLPEVMAAELKARMDDCAETGSRVGAMISVVGPTRSCSRTLSARAKPMATVLPDPVCEEIRRSRRPSSAFATASWTAVSFSNPRRFRAGRRGSGVPVRA